MTELQTIKHHVDEHGLGSAIVGDHVAIGVVWTTKTLDGRVRKREIIERAYSMEDAVSIIGCRCENRTNAA
ncbi:MAG: hypothetical protein A3E78_06370 [Alphaproteobacteria bacterium RIFCSPHIGHO2_12_FULL_63_12]|nr:MAG: hypothetical protein A3E78_06370 [Alphaproteobacteria bacterium RIFCSPHIGHO2_12_FULL_63_12]